ncbi:MAG TPA: AraC family transcriptional regulator [Nitrospiria bacterium]
MSRKKTDIKGTGSDKTRKITPKVQQILVYIESHFYLPLTLGYCASLVDLHPHYFSRKFKSDVGIPLREYILKTRLKRASILLMESHNQVKEIGAGVGFKSQENFSRNFKRMFGCSPREYRKNQLEKGKCLSSI